MDRIDMHIEVPALAVSDIRKQTTKESDTSHAIRKRVEAARQLQLNRQDCINARLEKKAIETYCHLRDCDQTLLETAMNRLGLSMRAYHKILRLARTIADINRSEMILTAHLSEAISYRQLDRITNS